MNHNVLKKMGGHYILRLALLKNITTSKVITDNTSHMELGDVKYEHNYQKRTVR